MTKKEIDEPIDTFPVLVTHYYNVEIPTISISNI